MLGLTAAIFFDQLVLIAGQAEDRLQARPDENHRHLRGLGRGDGVSWSAVALLGRVPVQADLHGRVGSVGRGLDLDVVRSGGELDGAAHVVEAVGGGNDVVLVGLQDVAVHAALECACGRESLAVER